MEVMTISESKIVKETDKIHTGGSDLLLCSACTELLFEPITLPCGNVVCSRCIRQKQQYYCCPAKNCNKKHYFRYFGLTRNESVNVLLQHLLYQIFPIEQQALERVKEAEIRLAAYFNPKRLVCKEECFPVDLKNKNCEIEEVIQIILNPVIDIVPYLQLPLIIRSKALAELGLFEDAIEDAKRAHFNNRNNHRGIVAEKLTIWREGMHQSDLHVLATCAISALTPENTVVDGVNPKVQNAAIDLRTELRNIQMMEYDTLPFSSTQLQPVLNHFHKSEMECHICLSTMKDPVTCPCGHSWCRACIVDSMNRSDTCPMCRKTLPSASYFVKRPTDRGLESILSKVLHCPSTDGRYTLSTTRKIPLFVCSLVFPGSKPGFHMFEPRYRAMIKKCMETNKEFGIVLSQECGGCKSFGTLVRITHAEALVNCDLAATPIGELPRYVVETVGLYRFKIMELSMSSIGYTEAVVEPLHDEDPEDVPHNPCHLETLMGQAQAFVGKLLLSVPPTARLHFERKHGNMPNDPSRFSFWLAEFLPMNPYTIYQLLPLTNVLERMQLICAWINEASVGKV
jgi:Lon protease-like protein